MKRITNWFPLSLNNVMGNKKTMQQLHQWQDQYSRTSVSEKSISWYLNDTFVTESWNSVNCHSDDVTLRHSK